MRIVLTRRDNCARPRILIQETRAFQIANNLRHILLLELVTLGAGINLTTQATLFLHGGRFIKFELLIEIGAVGFARVVVHER